jgi:ABC-type bacteriocin/lantibiotic exporter with double-glycine peptidase domain
MAWTPKWSARSRLSSGGLNDRLLRAPANLESTGFADFPRILKSMSECWPVPSVSTSNEQIFLILFFSPSEEGRGAISIHPRSLSRHLPVELRWLAAAIRPVWALHFVSLLAFSSGSTLGLLGPLVLRWLIDGILPEHSALLLAFAATLLFLSYEGRVILTSIGSWFTAAASQRIVLSLRVEILEHLDKLSADYHESTPAGEKLYTLREPVEEIAYLGSDLFPGILRTVLSTVLTVFAMAALSPRLTIAVLPVVPIFLMTRHHFRRRLAQHSDDLQDKRLELSSFLEEHIPSIIQIQSLQREALRERLAYRLFAKAARSQLHLVRTAAFFSIFSNLAIAVSLAAIIGYGGVSVLRGTLTVGSLVAFYSYLAQLFEPLSAAMEMYARAQKTFSSIRRVQSALATRPSIKDSPHAVPVPSETAAEIEFHDLRFGYLAQREVLRIHRLRIDAGQRVVLVGENGAGKSALAKIAARLFDPNSGFVTYGGVDLRTIPLKQFRSLAAYLSATPILFDDTLAANLRLGSPAATEEELAEVLYVVDLRTLIESFPLRYKQPLGPGGSRLSSGQRQRVALARSLLKRPKLLIFDEATSSIDPVVEHIVLDRIRLFLPDATVLLVSHHFSSVAWADRVITLEAGKILRDQNTADFCPN